MSTFRAAAIQMRSGIDVVRNVEALENWSQMRQRKAPIISRRRK